MSAFGWLIEGLRAIGRSGAVVPGGRRATVQQVRVHARYDAALTNPDNHRHWALADGLSADAAASPAVRRTLRNRSRYEVPTTAMPAASSSPWPTTRSAPAPGSRCSRRHSTGLMHSAGRARSSSLWSRTDRVWPEKLRTLRVALRHGRRGLRASSPATPAYATPVQARLANWSRPTGFAPPRLGSVDRRRQLGGRHRLRRGGQPGRVPRPPHTTPATDTWSWVAQYDRVPAESVIHVVPLPDRPGQAARRPRHHCRRCRCSLNCGGSPWRSSPPPRPRPTSPASSTPTHPPSGEADAGRAVRARSNLERRALAHHAGRLEDVAAPGRATGDDLPPSSSTRSSTRSPAA